LKLFVEPLLRSRDYLPGEKVTQTTVNDCFFPSRDLPSLLLARIYMEQGDWSKAKSMLAEVTNSGRYQLGDLVYQLPAFQASSGNQNDMVANICFSYTEVLLNLAEAALEVGDNDKMYEHKDSYVIEYFNIIKKIFVKTYYSLTKDDSIINRIKENKLYGINKTSTKYFDDILSSPRRRIK
jgi:hypothetical protein